jgi:magnesium chelatase family protein
MDVGTRDVSTVFSRAPLGLLAPLVRVEVHLGPGLPTFAMVGLPEAVVRESKERVRSALLTTGFGELRQTPKLLPALIQGSRSGRELILPFANTLEAGLLSAAHVAMRRALAVCGEATRARVTC